MKKPSFICVGAQKAGTTSLQEILSQHPSIYLSPLKEIKFFHRDEHYKKGVEWYFNHFKDAKDNQIIGDITPDYLLYGNTAQRILKDLGSDIKIITILRQPVNRTISQFNFFRSAEVEKETNFKKIITNYSEIDFLNLHFENWYTPSYYIERSLYYNQLKRYYDIFPKSNIHIIIFEEFFGNQHEVEMKKLLNFLELENINFQTNVHSHSTRVPKDNLTYKTAQQLKNIKELIKPFFPKESYIKLRAKVFNLITEKPKTIDSQFKKELFNLYFKDDVEKLESLIKKDLSIWR